MVIYRTSLKTIPLMMKLFYIALFLLFMSTKTAAQNEIHVANIAKIEVNDLKKAKAYYKIAQQYSSELKYEEAHHYYLLAANEGLVAAYLEVGMDNFSGCGTAQNYAEALKWVRKSAEVGEANGQFQLGEFYFYGNCGLEKDATKAVEWFLLAAKQSYSDAITALAYCYEQGIGVQENKEEAYNWYLLLAKEGELISQYEVGKYLLERNMPSNDTKEGIKWLKKSAKQGYQEAQCLLAKQYADGKLVSKDIKKAIMWYRKAAVSGWNAARIALEELGIEPPKSEEQHLQLYHEK